MHPKNIILYGVPGLGKTSLAWALSEAFSLPHFEVDEIRKIGKQGKSLEADPFFFLPTTEAYQAVGERIPENVVKGLLGVRAAYRDLISQGIDAHKEGCVAEAAFIDPSLLQDKGYVMLIVVPSEEKHRSQFLEHRTADAFVNGQFENARIIQDFLVKEARQLNVPIIENNGSMDELVEKATEVVNEK